MSAEDLIIIRGSGSVSALGLGSAPYGAPEATFTARQLGSSAVAVAALPTAAEAALTALRQQHPTYRQLDRTVLLALVAARQAAAQAGWSGAEELASLAVSIGSSRGATGRVEQFHEQFLTEGTVPAAASPLTTLGNVASWVAYDASAHGSAALSHSSTCSSAFQALGNALAWLRAGMAELFLAGGAEAPLTDFTLAQMQAIGIYSPFAAAEWPCRPGAGAPSTFTLGEGAAVFALEKASYQTIQQQKLVRPNQPIFQLESVGFGFEAIGSKTGLSRDGQHFQTAMRQALRQANRRPDEVDALVLHSPGTPAGDAAERAAIQAVFGENTPPLTSNKWLLGHTLGASAALSLDYALHLLTTQTWPTAPFATDLAPAPTRPLRRLLINAAGFGGNAASALVSLMQ
ncbi:beta-ketoacyl synthase N-terminal-like domain-containing protein [Hymenobacter sp. GOD-10R]|uniref:beta-ketoacyl synthase N-terminal-like domain-containing protein n=1 Tax=Hymenobacter sp. GOD-10R TaxID=3093922 RepID=UPI002D789C86|nr:beta-ketoacyl synthase N-terminal-like domain-containing protein [Hymenobacter sp. GOD-10R]WRQ26990.1 beta-ketoacyl synthase N-terminal-like domain-containing protein [Hymenobacter sp. GOD-10R]